MITKFPIALLCGASAIAIALPAPVLAQSSGAESGGLEEIVVTAQRRTERLENVPMALTALTADTLEKNSITNLHDLNQITPGVQINFGGTYTQPSIRGITALTNGNGNENNVAFYVDGFFVSDNSSLNTDLANIANVQVLKGPQGTLYGRQAAGGAILVNTLDPTDVLSGKFEGRYARFSEKRLSGYISGPLSEKLLFMASGAFRNHSGYFKRADPANVANTIGAVGAAKQRSFRSKLLWKASDDLKATFAYNYALSSDDRAGQQYSIRDYIPNASPNVGNRAQGFYTYSFNHKPLQVAETNEATLKVEWDTGIGKLTSYTGYQKRRNRVAFDFDGGYADLTFSDGQSKQRTFQQAVDYAINAVDKLDLIVGALYFNDHYYPDKAFGGSNSYGANKVLLAQTFRPLRTKAWAVYADGTYQLTDALSIGIGGRYSVDRKEVSQSSPFGPAIATFSGVNKTFHRFTPRATIRYEVADRTNVYASFSQGYKAGSFNSVSNPALLLATRPIKPEVVTAYEIGFKTAQRTFRFETSAFYYDYKDINISLTVTNPLGPQFGASTVIGNAPKSKIYGFDFQGVVEPVENLNVTIGGTWLHARYGNFINASGIGVDATNSFNISQPTQDWTGLQMARSPNFSANFSADYTFDLAGGGLRIAGNARYTDSYVPQNPSVFGVLAPVELRRKQRYRQGKHMLVGGEIQWTDPSDHYWFGVYGTNLTNIKTKMGYNGTGAGNYWLASQPISYGVKAGYKF